MSALSIYGVALIWLLYVAQSGAEPSHAGNAVSTLALNCNDQMWYPYQTYSNYCPSDDPEGQYVSLPDDSHLVCMFWTHATVHRCLMHGFFESLEKAMARANEHQWEIKAVISGYGTEKRLSKVQERVKLGKDIYEVRFAWELNAGNVTWDSASGKMKSI